MATHVLNPRRTRAARMRAGAGRRAMATVNAVRLRFRRPALTVTGLTCLSVAGFELATWLGWLVTGISVLLFEGLSE